MNKGNEGFIVSGGSVNAGSLAIGRGASAVQNNGAGPEESAQAAQLELVLAELHKAIAANKTNVDQPQDALEAVELLRGEMKRERPNRLTIRSILNGLKESVHTVAELAPLVSAARELVEKMFT